MNRFTAALYDLQQALAARRLDPRREVVVGQVQGRTLEVGLGTGQNLRLYPRSSWLVGVEPDAATLDRAVRRAVQTQRPRLFVRAVGEALPFRDATFDTVVTTLVFCSVADPAATLAEIRRVLAPQGVFRFMEHVRSDAPGWARFQDAVTPGWRFLLA